MSLEVVSVVVSVELHRLEKKEKKRLYNKTWRDNNKEAETAKKKTYRENNKEAIAARAKTWRDNNKEAETAKKKTYRENNKEAIAAKKKAYYENNKEAETARIKAWHKANPEKVRISVQNTKAKRASAEGTPDLDRFYDKFFIEQTTCVYCGKSTWDDFHVDHIVPLSRGGSNWVDNMQPLCAECNLTKNAKLPWEYEESIGFSRDPDFWNDFRLYSTPAIIYYTAEDILCAL